MKLTLIATFVCLFLAAAFVDSTLIQSGTNCLQSGTAVNSTPYFRSCKYSSTTPSMKWITVKGKQEGVILFCGSNNQTCLTILSSNYDATMRSKNITDPAQQFKANSVTRQFTNTKSGPKYCATAFLYFANFQMKQCNATDPSQKFSLIG